MTILGIDPGDKGFGWCLLRDGKVDSAGWEPLPASPGDRVRKIADWVYRDWGDCHHVAIEAQPGGVTRRDVVRVEAYFSALVPFRFDWMLIPPPRAKDAAMLDAAFPMPRTIAHDLGIHLQHAVSAARIAGKMALEIN